MTKVYLGDNLYEIHIGHRVLQFSGDELTEICEDYVEPLQQELERMDTDYKVLSDENDTLEDRVSELEKELEKCQMV